MASAYPSGFDSLAKPTATTKEDDAGFEHDIVHTNEANAIEAVQTTLGVNPQGASASVKARLDAVDSSLTGKVGTSDSRLTDARTPSDASVTDAKIATTLSPSKITGTAVVTADSRLSDARTPTAHAASHGSAGTDAVTLAQSQVTSLTTDLAGKVATSRTVSTTAPLSGGGDLSADRTLSIADATTSVKGAVQLTDSTSSTSTTTAATPNSVKTAYDLANGAVPKSTVTTLGDLIVGTGSAAVARLGKGSTGQVLTANVSSVDWATPAASGVSTVQDEGTALTARTTVNFTGAGVTATDNSGSTRTDVLVGGVGVKTAASKYHYPCYGNLTASFGTYQRAYYIPFTGGGNSFTSTSVYVDVANASGTIAVGVYSYSGGYTLVQIAAWGTVSTAATGFRTITISGGWTPTVGVVYYLGVLVYGSSLAKVRGASVIAPIQSANGAGVVMPSWGAYYSDALTALPASDAAPYNAQVIDQAPVVYLLSS